MDDSLGLFANDYKVETPSKVDGLKRRKWTENCFEIAWFFNEIDNVNFFELNEIYFKWRKIGNRNQLIAADCSWLQLMMN